MIRLTTLILCLFCVATFKGLAQLNPDMASGIPSSVIPPSPEASLMARYQETAVSPYTGIPQIRIPLDNLTAGSLDWPISLSYHAGGHKVEEHATRVGLGWTNDSYGMVGRGVRGLPDEMPDIGYIDYSKTVNYADLISGDIATNFDELTEISYNCADVQPDYFYFSVNGSGGKIIYEWGSSTPTVDANRPWKAIPSISNGEITQWVLTSDQGVTYTFSSRETTETTPVGLSTSCLPTSYTSAWYLTRVTDVNNVNFIALEYKTARETINSTFRASEYNRLPNLDNPPGCPGAEQGSTLYQTIYYKPVLEKITTSKGDKEVTFISGEARDDIEGLGLFRLAEIVITDKFDGFSKKFVLDNNNYSTGRLTLKGLTEVGKNNDQLPPYVFKYNSKQLPEVDSYSQDHWGFCNGSPDQNDSLIPKLWQITNSGYPLQIPGGNRKPNEEWVKAGLLEEIIFPSGAISKYDFEINKYSTALFENTDIPKYNTTIGTSKRQEGYTNDPTVAVNAGDEAYTLAFFDLSQNAAVQLQYYGFHNGPGFPSQIRPYIEVIDNETETVEFREYFTSGDAGRSPEELTKTQDIYLRGGTTYRVVAYAVWHEQGEFNDIAFFQVNIPVLIPGSGTSEKITGGVRIQKITDFAFPNDPSPKIRRYEYLQDDGLSSGIIYMIPDYVGNHVGYITQGTIEFECTNRIARAHNTISIGNTQGSHIGYEQVTEYFGQDGEFGQIVYNYTSPRDYPGGIHTRTPYPPHSDKSYKTGLLLSKKYKSKNGDAFNTYREENYSYLFHEYKIPTLKVTNNGGQQGLSFPHKYVKGLYSANIGHAVVGSTRQVEIRNGVEKDHFTENTYDSRLQRVQQSQIQAPSGDRIKISHYYPDNFTYPSSAINAMNNLHFIGTPIETVRQLLNDQLWILESNFNQFKLDGYGNLHLGATFRYRPTDSPLDESLFDYSFDNTLSIPTIDYEPTNSVEYDTYSNIVSLWGREDGLKTSFIWGYNHSRPIVQIKDATYGELTAAFAPAELTTLQANVLSETQAFQLYQTLKTAFPTKHFQIFGYDILFGTSFSIDQNGILTKYNYDTFGRLESVEDFEGNITEAFEYKLSRQN